MKKTYMCNPIYLGKANVKTKCPFCRVKSTNYVASADNSIQVECYNCGARGPIYGRKIGAKLGWDFGDDVMIVCYKQKRLLWPEDVESVKDKS